MSRIADIREALADRIATTGIRANPYQSDSLNTPQAMLGFEIPDYDLVFQNGACVLPFTIWVFGQRADEISTQRLFDQLLDPSSSESIRSVIHADDTLGGLCDYVWVKSATAPRMVRVGAVDYLMIEIAAEVCFRPEEG